MRKQTNYHTVHTKHGRVSLIINDVVVRVTGYSNVQERQKLIDRWRMEYPPRPHQKRELIIHPNWEAWNGVIGDEDEEIERERYKKTLPIVYPYTRADHIYIN